MKEVPTHIITAINALLAPYGESYTPGVSAPQTLGYKGPKDAAAYIGVALPTFYEIVRRGDVPRIKLNKAHNGKAVYAVSDLESYIARCRSGSLSVSSDSAGDLE